MTRRASSSDRVIRGQGGASWHLSNNWLVCRFRGSFFKIMENPQVRFRREHFSRMKRQKIYRLSLLPSNLLSNRKFPSEGKVADMSSQGDQNLKNHENHDFQAALALKTRFSSQGRCAAAQCLKIQWLTRRAFSSDRVIRGQGGASWHLSNNWLFCRFRGGFSKIMKNP